MEQYKVVTGTGEVVLVTDNLAQAVNKCYEVDGFITDQNGNMVEC